MNQSFLMSNKGGVQQGKSRDFMFQNIGPEKAIYLRDFAQKVNPSIKS